MGYMKVGKLIRYLEKRDIKQDNPLRCTKCGGLKGLRTENRGETWECWDCRHLN